MSAGSKPLHQPTRSARADFDDLYDRALPVVYGYLLRLCGGNADDAWDLTQDTWFTVVQKIRSGQSTMSVGYVLAVARTKYLDGYRRRERLTRKLRLVWAAERTDDGPGARAAAWLSALAAIAGDVTLGTAPATTPRTPARGRS